MIKRFICIILWVIFTAALHLFGNNAGTFILFVVSLAVPAVSGAAVLVAARVITKKENLFVLLLPDICAKGEEISCKIICKQGAILFLFKISWALVCENLLTGEKEFFRFEKISKKENEFVIQASHCGVLRIRGSEILTADPLGLFSRRIYFGAESSKTEAHIIIPPVGFAVAIPPGQNAADHDSNEYSTTKAGTDVSEIFAIREYIPGDPIRGIHWKLTEKLDKVMVREFGLPIGNSVLLVLDTAPGAEISPAGWDAAAELFYSAALALPGEGIRAAVSWQHAEAGGFSIFELREAADAAAAMRECLLTYNKNGAAFERQQVGYENIFIVTPGNAPEISLI
jgi:uncharacterized protein (DUF58 family)